MRINSLFQTMRSWIVFGFGFLVIALMAFGGTKISHAGDTKISGFGDLTYQAMNSQGGAGTGERLFKIAAELDIEREMNAAVGVRIDLDFPGGVLEQARFDWMMNEDFRLKLTGGKFNSPIGFEAQDAPDLLQISTGFLFDLVPSNLTGVMLSGGMEMVNVSLIAANEIHGTSEENTIGGVLTLTPMEDVSISVGGLIAPEKKAGDKDILNIVAQTSMIPSVLLAAEYTLDDNNRGVGVVANMTHDAAIPHWLTLRWNGVWTDAGSTFNPFSALGCAGSSKCKYNSYTAAVGAEFVAGLATILEYSLLHGAFDDGSGVDREIHQIIAEAVFTF